MILAMFFVCRYLGSGSVSAVMFMCSYLSLGRVVFEYGLDRASWLSILAANVFDGILLSDSFLTGNHQNFFAHQSAIGCMLSTISRVLAKNYVFVMRRGGAFGYGDFGDFGVYLAETINMSIHFVWVAMGNDVYNGASEEKLHKLCGKINVCLNRVARQGHRVTLVFGGSSLVWQYAETHNSSFAAKYDKAVGFVLKQLREYGHDALSGCHHLQGIRLVDRLGHVDWSHSASCEYVQVFLLHVIGRRARGSASKL